MLGPRVNAVFVFKTIAKLLLMGVKPIKAATATYEQGAHSCRGPTLGVLPNQ